LTPLLQGTTSAFISYAREDAAFAHLLDIALTARGIRVLIDRSAIAPAEEFEKRLGGMILEADAVVFLMSPDALASRYCQWEVARAEELQKRIVPVVWRDFDDTGYRPPEGLAKRNWIFFDAFQRLGADARTDDPAFTVPFEQIIAAITTDIDWQRAHTRHIARSEPPRRRLPAFRCRDKHRAGLGQPQARQ
jgi:TIR domain